MGTDMNSYSIHASRRAQQRGIPPLIDELLDLYGREECDGRGGVIVYLDRSSIRRMERDMGRAPVRRLAEWHNAYKVRSSKDGTTITVGRRHRHLRGS
jgi:hypothetical protein